jgi:hypothetical protein
MNSDLKAIIRYAEDIGHIPSMVELNNKGYTREWIRQHYGSITSLKAKIAANTSKLFDLEFHKPSFNLTDKKRFVITTACSGAKVSRDFLKSIKTYCKFQNAELIILPSFTEKITNFDPILRNENVCLNNIDLNTNVFLLGIKNKTTKADPISGLPRLGRRNGTFISPSPKQRLKYIATGHKTLPHALMTTGAITIPSYPHKHVIRDLQSIIAESDHVMGAVIVEIESDDIFHFRQIQADNNGQFADMGYLYTPRRKVRYAPCAMVLGDWHSGKTCAKVKKASLDITGKLGIKEWIMHDVYDSHSANHHEKGKLLLLSQKANVGELNLNKELMHLALDLTSLSRFVNKITIVKSNHDEFLERYLDSGAWMKHPYNTEICIELAAAMLKDINPVKYAVDKFSNNAKKLNWLNRDESYKIAGIECGAHGDKGSNGTRGNITSMENAYGDVVYGHTHTPEILRGAWCVGTSTFPYPDYGTGPSSWMNTHCLIYPNGQRQLVNIIEGKYTL